MLILPPAAITFYAATWETYYTHTLYLGYINGPVDGTLGICVAFLLTGFYGARMPRPPILRKWVDGGVLTVRVPFACARRVRPRHVAHPCALAGNAERAQHRAGERVYGLGRA